MYALIVNAKVKKYPYSMAELRADNPQTSFPDNPSKKMLESFGVFEVKETPRPSVGFDKDVEETNPVFDGFWKQCWAVIDASQEKIKQRKDEYNQAQEHLRMYAYQQEADPLFFKAQRGEAKLEDWKSKINEIKLRYPKE